MSNRREQHQQKAVSLNNESVLYLALGDCEAAKRCLKRCIGELRKCLEDGEQNEEEEEAPTRTRLCREDLTTQEASAACHPGERERHACSSSEHKNKRRRLLIDRASHVVVEEERGSMTTNSSTESRRIGGPSGSSSYLSYYCCRSVSTRGCVPTCEAEDALGNLFLPYTKGFVILPTAANCRTNGDAAGTADGNEEHAQSAVTLFNWAWAFHASALKNQQQRPQQHTAPTQPAPGICPSASYLDPEKQEAAESTKSALLRKALRLYQTSLNCVCLAAAAAAGAPPQPDPARRLDDDHHHPLLLEERQRQERRRQRGLFLWSSGLSEVLMALWNNMGHIYSALGGSEQQVDVCLANLQEELAAAVATTATFLPATTRRAIMEPLDFFQRVVLCAQLQRAQRGWLAAAA